MTPNSPITRSGLTVLITGAVSLVPGVLFRWQEFVVVAIGCFLLLIVSSLFAFGHLSISIQRHTEPNDISVGTRAFSKLVCTNETTRRKGAVTLEDAIDGTTYVRRIPALDPGESHEIELELPTGKRARLTLGPVRVVREDPLGLFSRSRKLAEPITVYVWPRTHQVRLDALGQAQDLDGQTSDSSPAGSESFHTIREYQLGDDHRHVHWRSTAKTGFQTLLVRQFVDNRKPELIVALDTSTPYSEPGFELAVEIAASLVKSATTEGLPTKLLVGDNETGQGLSKRTLDLLATIDPEPTDEADHLRRVSTSLHRGHRSAASVVAIVGDVDAEMPIARLANTPASTLDIIRITAPAQPPKRVDLRTRLIDIDQPETFKTLWTGR